MRNMWYLKDCKKEICIQYKRGNHKVEHCLSLSLTEEVCVSNANFLQFSAYSWMTTNAPEEYRFGLQKILASRWIHKDSVDKEDWLYLLDIYIYFSAFLLCLYEDSRTTFTNLCSSVYIKYVNCEFCYMLICLLIFLIFLLFFYILNILLWF